MAKAPKIYTNTSAYIECIFVISKEVLTLGHLQPALNKFWKIKHGYDSDSDSDDEDRDEKAELMAASIEAEKYDMRNKGYFKCVKLEHFTREYESGEGNNNTFDK